MAAGDILRRTSFTTLGVDSNQWAWRNVTSLLDSIARIALKFVTYGAAGGGRGHRTAGQMGSQGFLTPEEQETAQNIQAAGGGGGVTSIPSTTDMLGSGAGGQGFAFSEPRARARTGPLAHRAGLYGTGDPPTGSTIPRVLWPEEQIEPIQTEPVSQTYLNDRRQAVLDSMSRLQQGQLREELAPTMAEIARQQADTQLAQSRADKEGFAESQLLEELKRSAQIRAFQEAPKARQAVHQIRTRQMEGEALPDIWRRPPAEYQTPEGGPNQLWTEAFHEATQTGRRGGVSTSQVIGKVSAGHSKLAKQIKQGLPPEELQQTIQGNVVDITTALASNQEFYDTMRAETITPNEKLNWLHRHIGDAHPQTQEAWVATLIPDFFGDTGFAATPEPEMLNKNLDEYLPRAVDAIGADPANAGVIFLHKKEQDQWMFDQEKAKKIFTDRMITQSMRDAVKLGYEPRFAANLGMELLIVRGSKPTAKTMEKYGFREMHGGIYRPSKGVETYPSWRTPFSAYEGQSANLTPLTQRQVAVAQLREALGQKVPEIAEIEPAYGLVERGPFVESPTQRIGQTGLKFRGKRGSLTELEAARQKELEKVFSEGAAEGALAQAALAGWRRVEEKTADEQRKATEAEKKAREAMEEELGRILAQRLGFLTR